MNHRRVISVIAMVMLLAGLAVVPVLAQPPICTFTGSVTLDGNPCPGSIVTAEVEGQAVGEPETVAADSAYRMLIPQDLDTGFPAAGATVDFFVDGYPATTSGDAPTWAAGSYKTVNLAAGGPPPPYYILTMMAVNPAGSGTTTPAVGTHSYAAGTVVTLTATAASADWEFDRWTGDVACASCASTTVTMTSHKSVKAYFKSTVPPAEYATFADWMYHTFIK